jgi:hypothetical protein
MMTTISQAAAIERMLLMGELFFSGTQVSAIVKLKLNPLLCGPTGVGTACADSPPMTPHTAFGIRLIDGLKKAPLH